MSAASSGFELPYVVVPIKEEDQDGLRRGARALQKADICWHPNRAFEDWWVKKVDRTGDKYTVAPIRGRWACGLQRTIPRRVLDTEYKVKVRRPC